MPLVQHFLRPQEGRGSLAEWRLEELVDELREEIRQLRDQLKVEPARETVARFQAAFQLSRSQAIILAVLYGANVALPVERLSLALPYKDGEPRSPQTVRVLCWQLRQRMYAFVSGQDAIQNTIHAGYRLSDLGRAVCAVALGGRRG